MHAQITAPHYDQKGNELDGRRQPKNLRYASVVSTNHQEIQVDPQLDTMDSAMRRLNMSDNVMIGNVKIDSKHQRSQINTHVLARRWGTSVQVADETRKQTTQRGIRYLGGTLERRFRTRQHQLQSPLLKTKFYSDTMFSETTSIRGNTCAQLFVTSEGYVTGDVMKQKSDAYLALEKLCRDDGIPAVLVTDMTEEELYGDWGRIVKQNLIDQRTTEPHSGWKNRCEGEIREFKKHHNRIMALHRAPKVFWDFAWIYTKEIRQFLTRSAA